MVIPIIFIIVCSRLHTIKFLVSHCDSHASHNSLFPDFNQPPCKMSQMTIGHTVDSEGCGQSIALWKVALCSLWAVSTSPVEKLHVK